MGIDREIGILEDKLQEVAQWEARLAELNRLLSAHDDVSDSEDAVVV